MDEHGDYLFMRCRGLRDPLKAEDAVQETFLAALSRAAKVSGRSAEKSWLVGILKNKVCDHYRKAGRETSFTDLEFYKDEESDRFVQEGLFRTRGFTRSARRNGTVRARVSTVRCSGRRIAIARTSCRKTSRRCSTYARWTASKKGNLRVAEHLGEQSMGDAASRADGVAAVSGDELVRQTRRARNETLRLAQNPWFVIWVWKHTPSCAEMSRLTSRALEQPLTL